jgi:hypothetical protein
MGNLPQNICESYLKNKKKAVGFFAASTGQGARGASIMCVPDWLNGFYGYI